MDELSFSVLHPSLCVLRSRLKLTTLYPQPALTDSLVYNAKVFASLAKQVYVKENLAPPTSVAQITAAYANAWSKASNFSYWSKLWSSGQWKTFGVYVSPSLPSGLVVRRGGMRSGGGRRVSGSVRTGEYRDLAPRVDLTSDRGRWHPSGSSRRLRLWMRKRRDRDWLLSPSQLKHRKSLTFPLLASIPHRLSRLTDSSRSERWLDDEASSATALRSPTFLRSTKAGLERILADGQEGGEKTAGVEREEDRWYRTSLHYGTATERQDETTQAFTGLLRRRMKGEHSNQVGPPCSTSYRKSFTPFPQGPLRAHASS